jgi:hypothetical protein
MSLRSAERGPGISTRKQASGSAQERELRAKYFDWCSARIAERFVNLSVREIYELADSATSSVDGDRSFQVVMERATEVLAAQTALPGFEEWAEAYRSDPSRYDADLIGFWREQL